VRRLYRRSPAFIRKLFRSSARRLPVSHDKLSLDFKIKRFVQGAEDEAAVSHYRWREVFAEEEKQELFRDGAELQRRFGPSADLFSVHFAQSGGDDELNKLLGLDCAFHLPDDLMIKNDRMTMAHSLEARVPFTDVPLFECLAGLSSDLKLHGFTLKYLLKEAMKPYLPPEILHKKKIGLEIPYSKWFCGELKELLLDSLAEASLQKIPLLNSRFVQRIIGEHLEKRRDRGRELWGLLNFVTWYRMHF
jgi:asparagine synthase (glutamine-hydrolysing)